MGALQLLSLALCLVILPSALADPDYDDLPKYYPFCPARHHDERGPLCYFRSNAYKYFCCKIHGHWACCRKTKEWVVITSIVGASIFFVALFASLVAFCCGLCCFSPRRRPGQMIYYQTPVVYPQTNYESTATSSPYVPQQPPAYKFSTSPPPSYKQ